MSKLGVFILIISVLGVLLEIKQKPVFWLLYILGAVLLGYEFFITRLYGSSILQLIYIFLSIYGWYKWTNNDAKHDDIIICRTTFVQWVKYTVITIIMTVVFYYLLEYTGDPDCLPDAAVTALCATGTYMAVLKQLESWFVLASTVVISVPLYLHYQLYFTSATYVVFGILDLIGGIKWLNDYRRTQELNGSMI